MLINRLIIAVLFILLAVEFHKPVTRFFQAVELWHFSSVQRLVNQNRPNSGVDIIAVDDRTRSNPEARILFGRDPIRRDAFGYALNFLNRAKARYAILDYTFVLAHDQRFPEADQLLVDSINQTEIPVMSALINRLKRKSPTKSTLPSIMQQQKLTINGPLEKFGYTLKNWTNPPIEILHQTPMHYYSGTSIYFDSSNTVRQTIPFEKLHDDFYPTMPLAAYLNGEKTLNIFPDGGFETAHAKVNFHGKPFPIIRWYGNANIHVSQSRKKKQTLGPITETFSNLWQTFLPTIQTEEKHYNHVKVYPQYSLWDIVRTEIQLECNANPKLAICSQIKPVPQNELVSPDWFRNRYVFIGKTATNSNADSHQTIYGVTHYPGVYIQANILDNYLNNDFVKQAPNYYPWAATALLAVVAIIACIKLPVLFSLFLFVVLAGFYSWWTGWIYVNQNIWLNWTWPMLGLIFSFVGAYIFKYLNAEKLKQHLRYAFAKYVSSGVMSSIEENPNQIQLGGQRKELTLLFTDIRGFTTFSENNEPEVVQACLTEYFSVMNSIILNEYHGSINKLIGDAIMAYWGFPVETEDHAFLAVSAALKMKEAMENWLTDDSKPEFRIGIGLNTGEAVIGNVGSQDFMDFTVIGDAVNVAARLESATKEHQATILISEATYNKVKDRINATFIAEITVKGKEEPIRIYEPIALK